MTPRISQFATFIIVTSLASPPQSQYALDLRWSVPGTGNVIKSVGQWRIGERRRWRGRLL